MRRINIAKRQRKRKKGEAIPIERLYIDSSQATA
ncbi:hypothetical protein J2Z52_001649 [Enterococcus rivorum]|nr:hypothetical protein [Enterococcus rivorum]